MTSPRLRPGWRLALLLACFTLGAVLAGEPLPHHGPLSLAGSWRLALDRQDLGATERWFNRPLPEDASIHLPGSLPGQGYGDSITTNTPWIGGIVDKSFFTAPAFAPYRVPGNVRIPFWLQPETHYAGVAWYQRDLRIPPAWQGRRVVLRLERPHWETRVWLDDRFIGSNDSLSTPHEYDLGVDLAAGTHRLTIRVDNRMVIDIGENSHSISDHTQGNWNGIVGQLELRSTTPVWIEDLQVHPSFARQEVTLRGRLGNATGQAGNGTLVFRIEPASLPSTAPPPALHKFPVQWEPDGASFECTLPVASPKPWDEFHRALYDALAWIEGLQGPLEARVARFGFRDFAADGTQFTINGRKTFLRGTLECAIFPRTGHTPTDVESWRHVIRAAQAHGLNNLRFHSHCPPEAAFQAADELGMYLHVECGTWPNQSTTLGDGKPVDAWLYRETDRILQAYGNHPSFVILLHGNEPGGPHHVPFLKRWVDHYKLKDTRRLYSSGAGWPQIPENQLHVSPDPRVQGWGQGLASRLNARPPETVTDYRDYIAARPVPVVSHEIGQWCVYPNFDEIPKYTGYLKPRNFEIFRDSLRARGMLDQARNFLFASGRLQTVCYKEDIESALRTPGMAGFQLLDLHDFPGQGTALVGVLDPFWESKGYVTPDEYRRFCNSTVPLARLPKRVFTTAERLEADLEVAHFGPAPLTNAVVAWQLRNDDDRVLARGDFAPALLPVGNAHRLGHIGIDLGPVPAPARYRLVVSVKPSTAALPRGFGPSGFVNDWDVWVYPPRVSIDVPPGITVVQDLDAQAESVLNAGGTVLWLLPPSRVKPDPQLGKVALGFTSIFWNTAWTGRQPPHTLGILCEPDHPLFRRFPTEAYSNWQWWYLVSRAGAMILDDLPRGLRPTVQVIDDWVTNRKLGLVFEARVRSGKLLVCSVDLASQLESDPVRRQFRRSLLDYLASDRFDPLIPITLEQARQVSAPPSPLENLGARLRASSHQPGHEPALAIDGNPTTMWHTAWGEPMPSFPHELTLELNSLTRLHGLTFLPRQDNNRNGWIKDYTLHTSPDGNAWGEPIAAGTFAADAALKTVRFANPVSARFVRLTARSGHANGPWASLAELGLLAEP